MDCVIIIIMIANQEENIMKKRSRNLLTVILSALMVCIMSFPLVGCTNSSAGNKAEEVGAVEFFNVLGDYIKDVYFAESESNGEQSYNVLANKTYTETAAYTEVSYVPLEYKETADSELATKMLEMTVNSNKKVDIRVKDVDGVPFVYINIITEFKGVGYIVNEETKLLDKLEVNDTVAVEKYYGLLDGKYYGYKIVKGEMGGYPVDSEGYALYYDETEYLDYIVREINNINMSVTMPLMYVYTEDNLIIDPEESYTRSEIINILSNGVGATERCILPIAYADKVAITKSNDVYTVNLEISGMDMENNFTAIAGYHVLSKNGITDGGVSCVAFGISDAAFMGNGMNLTKTDVKIDYAITDGAEFDVLKAIPEVELDEYILDEEFTYDNRGE